MDLAAEFRRSISELLEKANKDVVRASVEALYEAGEEGVIEAVNTGTYQDRTGKLRSSIYYEVDEPNNSVTLAAAAPYAMYVERVHNKIVLEKGIERMNEVIEEKLVALGLQR